MKSAYRTIPVKPATYRRLKDYKMGAATFDDVLNQLMDAWPLEVVSKRFIEEHKRRMKSKDWVPLEEVARELGLKKR